MSRKSAFASHESMLVSAGIIKVSDPRNRTVRRERVAKLRRLLLQERHARFIEQHGMTQEKYNKDHRMAQWIDLVGDEPLYTTGIDAVKWDSAVEGGKGKLSMYRDNECIPNADGGYFTFWHRLALMTLRGGLGHFLATGHVSIVDKVHSFTLGEDGRFYVTFLYRADIWKLQKLGDMGVVASGMRTGSRVDVGNGLESVTFPLSNIPKEVWTWVSHVPGMVMFDAEETPKMLLDMFAIHRLSLVPDSNFSKLSTRFEVVSPLAREENKCRAKQALITKLLGKGF